MISTNRPRAVTVFSRGERSKKVRAFYQVLLKEEEEEEELSQLKIEKGVNENL